MLKAASSLAAAVALGFGFGELYMGRRLALDQVNGTVLKQVQLQRFLRAGPFPSVASNVLSLEEATKGRCALVMAVRRPG